MKRLLLVLALLLPMGTVHGQGFGPEWTCSLDNQADDIAVCIVAPEPGLRRYITDVIAQSTDGSAGRFQLQYNTAAASGGAANCGAGSGGFTMLPPGLDASAGARFAADANTLKPTTLDLTSPLIVPSGNDLCVQGDADHPVTIQITGRVGP